MNKGENRAFKGWVIRFGVQHTHCTILSKAYEPFSIAEMEEFTDQRLRSAIRRLCGLSK
jgi:hypothetical protein